MKKVIHKYNLFVGSLGSLTTLELPIGAKVLCAKQTRKADTWQQPDLSIYVQKPTSDSNAGRTQRQFYVVPTGVNIDSSIYPNKKFEYIDTVVFLDIEEVYHVFEIVEKEQLLQFDFELE